MLNYFSAACFSIAFLCFLFQFMWTGGVLYLLAAVSNFAAAAVMFMMGNLNDR